MSNCNKPRLYPVELDGYHPAERGISEDALALKFVARYLDYRFVADQGRWRRWDKTRWTDDKTTAVWDAIRQFLRSEAQQANTDSEKTRLRNAATVRAVERLAQTDQRIAVCADVFDRDEWLLNTSGGLLNLKTGSLDPHDPDQYCTKITTAALGRDCPRWLQFLGEITGNNDELVDFLQRVAGYSLTGSTREHALFFCYGNGANGKGTFLNTISALLGDYATTAASETFVDSFGDRHPTELAKLAGARLVIAQEIDAGRAWNESRLKALTGGDPISARFMRQDEFVFTPQFKLFIAGNHKPRIKNLDEAMQRRLHLVPFSKTIPPDQRDPDLAEKLADELPGILGWAISGCLDYLADGLNPPEIVKAATAEYFEAQDCFADWLDSSCEQSPNAWEAPSRLFQSWKRHCEFSGERTGRKVEFAERLDAAGFIAGKSSSRGGRYWKGLKLLPTAEPEVPYFD